MDIPRQLACSETLRTKYFLKDSQGTLIENNIEEMWERVSKSLSQCEGSDKDYWAKKFYWALENGAIPAGRILSNAGANLEKPCTSTINCVVSGTIEDSMDSIFSRLHESALSLKAGCGIGYEFSTLRPKGARIKGAGARTSGPLSFMDTYNSMCFSVASAGGRRGAQMATFRIDHPDVVELIKAKRQDGRLRQFNLSLLITDEFIKKVRNNESFQLVFPASKLDREDENATFVWKDWSYSDTEHYEVNERGQVKCLVYGTINAAVLWELIMRSTYDYAEPGFILIDRLNSMNNLWFCENIMATNPCGEQPLPPYGSCLLGSINLTKFVVDHFNKPSFNYTLFDEVVSVFTRMLDNVVEISGLPLPQQQREIMRKRRHGMGITGLGSACTLLGLPYGEPNAVSYTETISKRLAEVGWETGIELAQEKGPAPIMTESFEITPEILRRRPDLKDKYEIGRMAMGRQLIAESHYFENLDSSISERISLIGARFSHHTSIAPTGTISYTVGNNVSNGIEPSYDLSYLRNIIVEGKQTKQQVKVDAFELLAYKKVKGIPSEDEVPKDQLPTSFRTAKSDITPDQHIAMQAAAQPFIDSSISKTCNVPTDISFDDFQNIYMKAYDMGLKGCTTFRFNPEAFSGVLVSEEDLRDTQYKFTLSDGSELTLSGMDEVEYMGEMHTASNLHDAIKEGYFGKY